MKKTALIGCGRISAKHLDAIIDNNDKLVLSAVCDISVDRAINKKEAYIKKAVEKGLPALPPTVYTEYKHMLENEEIDICAVATESGKHFQITMDCLEKKKHILVEKPIALNPFDADKMTSFAKKQGVLLGVCHQNRFNPSIRGLKKAIDDGRFGKIYSGSVRVLWSRNKAYYAAAAWRGTALQDGGCLMNQCIHGIDALLWLIGSEPQQINGIIKNYQHPYIECEDYGNIQILFENGSVGSIEGTVNIFDKNLFEMLSIFGENGTVIISGEAMNTVEHWKFRDGADSLEQIRNIYNQELDNIYGYGHSSLYRNFINSIDGKEDLIVSGEEGKRAVELIYSVYEKEKQKGM